MIRSMTGYGRAEAEEGGQRISVEIRSLNHRFCEVSARVPKSLAHLENRVRDMVQERLERGKAYVSVGINGREDDLSDIQINQANAQKYLALARQLQMELGVSGTIDLKTLISLPDVLVHEPVKVDEEDLWSRIRPVVQAALDDIDRMRTEEGRALAGDLKQRAGILEESVGRIEARLPQWMVEGKQKLTEKIKGLTKDADFNQYRLEAEIVLFVDRFDCTEECVRLRSHLRQLTQWIDDPAPAGRKLNFLLQEINRETNTIGSKAQDVEIAREVVLLKEEVEKIREQVQNIE
ncbi:MAG: YicC family protein [Candidatus Eisenbacteria bacterium]|nr:YicC family protein [Candidatus Eisenbacteria bacterium]